MYKIGIIDEINPKGIEILKNNKNFKYELITDLSKDNLLKKLPEFDGITLRRGKIDSSVLMNCKKLKVISRHGVGYDNVDTDYIKRNNIKLLVTDSSTSTSPAEHIMFMIISIYKGINMFDTMVRSGNFAKAIHLDIKENFELNSKNILIIGFGRIGRKLIKKCLGFDLNVSVYDPFVDEKTINSFGGKKISDLNSSLKETDIVSLSLPKNEKTINLISLNEMKIMKKSSILINVSRGGIVNEKDLVVALENEIIAGAGLDVYDKEPLPQDHKLRFLPNALLLPHIGYVTAENYSKFYLQMIENLEGCIINKPLRKIS